MENKNRNRLIVLIPFIVLIFIVFYLLIKMDVITFNLDNLFRNNNNIEQEVIDNAEQEKNENNAEQENDTAKIEEKQTGEFTHYLCFKSGYGFNIYKDISNCADEILGTIKTETENVKSLDYYRYYKQNGKIENIVALVDDNGLKLYDTEGNVKKVNLENNYSKYHLVPMEANVSSDTLGVEYYENDNRMFYNIKSNRTLKLDLPKKYVDVEMGGGWLSEYSLDYAVAGGDFISISRGESQGGTSRTLVSALNGKIVENESINNAYKFSNKYFFTNYLTVYSNGFKEIVTDGLWTIASDGYLYYNNKKDNKLLKYDIDGNLVSTIKDYENIKLLTDDYIVYINGSKELIAKNMITKEIIKIKDMKDGDVFFENGRSRFAVSIYRKNLIGVKSTETGEYREEGLYLIIENNNNWTEYYYNPITKVVMERDLGIDYCIHYEFNNCHD